MLYYMLQITLLVSTQSHDIELDLNTYKYTLNSNT